MLLRTACICLLFVAGAGSLSAKEPRQIRETGGAFVGSIGCKSSSCHGGAGPKRSQYITWSLKDFHTKAYAVLLNSRSERMAEGLGIGPAQSSARCTVCHSPMQSVAPSRLTRTAPPDEGVSCETCHGAAGGWLRGHTRTDWTYNTRVAAGMRDLKNLYVRANACVACHQNLAPELLKAGHPDLFFELDGQSVAQPKHWKDEEPWSGLRQWLTGQAVALREMSWALAGDPQNDAFSIARWDGLAWLCATATSAGKHSIAGEPALELSRPVGFHQHASTGGCPRPPRVGLQLERQLRAIPCSPRWPLWTRNLPRRELPTPLLGQRAKRLVLALDRLVNALGQNRGAPLKIDPELNQLFQDVKTLDAFDAARLRGPSPSIPRSAG